MDRMILYKAMSSAKRFIFAAAAGDTVDNIIEIGDEEKGSEDRTLGNT